MPTLTGVAIAILGIAAGMNLSISFNAVIDTSRVTGVAPLYVGFSGRNSTDPATNNSFRFTGFSWNFGDIGAPNTANAPLVVSKNLAYGPCVGHVYDSPGVYTVTETVKSADGITTKTQTVQITVLDPDVVYAGAATICLTNGVDFTGAPAGCVQLGGVTDIGTSVAAFILDNVRIMYKGTDTFIQSSTLNCLSTGTHSGILFTSWGGGQATLTNSSATDTTSTILQLGSGIGNVGDNITIHNLNFTGSPSNLSGRAINCFDQNVTPDVMTKGHNCVHNCTSSNLAIAIGIAGYGSCVSQNNFTGTIGGTGTVLVFGLTNGMKYFSLIDNFLDRGNTGEHCVRIEGLLNSYLANNRLKRITSSRHLMTLRGMPGVSVGMYNDGIVISNNYFDMIGSVGTPASHLQVAPINSTTLAPCRNVLIDHNFFSAYDYVATTFYDCPAGIMSAEQITIRHNAINVSSYDAAGVGAGISSGFQFQQTNTAGQLPCDDVFMHHNTMYGSTKIKTAMIIALANVTRTTFRDNLAYVPLAWKDGFGVGIKGVVIQTPVPTNTWTADHNSSDLQMCGNGVPANAVDPHFVTAVPLVMTDYALQAGSGSYALVGSSTGGALGLDLNLAAV